MYKNCTNHKPQCETFREHVGNGPFISATVTPTRGNGEARSKLATEAKWHKENDAFKRLDKQGYTLPHLNGADKIEREATTEIELKHGKLYGEKTAKTMEKAERGDFL